MRRPYLYAGGRLHRLHREPAGDGVAPALPVGEASCVECQTDLALAIYSAYACLFRCRCGHLYPVRYAEAA
jgi:hypothetical protein